MLSPDQRQFPHPRSRGMCQRQRIQMSASRSAVARRKHASARLSSPRRRYARPPSPGHAPAPPTGSIAAPARRLRGCVERFVELEELEIEAADGVRHAGNPVPVLRLGRIVAELLIPL